MQLGSQCFGGASVFVGAAGVFEAAGVSGSRGVVGAAWRPAFWEAGAFLGQLGGQLFGGMGVFGHGLPVLSTNSFFFLDMSCRGPRLEPTSDLAPQQKRM